MASRHESRERALQMLFQWDQSRESPEQVIAGYWGGLFSEEMHGEESPRRKPVDEFANELLRGAVKRVAEADALIRQYAEHWRLERMSAVDRNVLRLAIFELLQRQTPPPVVIDEALEIARRFSGEESVQFVNGVLDAVRKAL
ncbi:MAG TPA: transcription antitermination factor NusB [Bryobacterales bacterium]|jgi:N utilization substance protein B|nr:transcription antitermination factor NusB [Bryobacterales bacterium]